MRGLSKLTWTLLILSALSVQPAVAQREQINLDQAEALKLYPIRPDKESTPGSLCDTPDEYRYPEKIGYCRRDVETQTKLEIFEHYDENLGYKTRQINRMKFKIDHLIPLCAGGSNDIDNLWPQHESVYTLTDPLESTGCELLSQGLMSQAQIIQLILEAKNNPKHAKDIHHQMLKVKQKR